MKSSSGPTPGSIPQEALLAAFRDPASEFRPVPFTVLNDEYEPGRGERQLSRLIERLAEAGYGGAYLHPRPGLITEYFSPRWFELIRHCLDECQRCGLTPHLYDENSYPSGFSGGHVPARVPEARTRNVVFVTGQGKDALPGNALTLCRWDGSAPGEALSVADVDDATSWVAFVLKDLAPIPWYGETAYPSLLDPRVTEAFLETTYDRYREELGDRWGQAPSIFTDEPHLGSEAGPWATGLHLTTYLLGQFRQRLGYDLTPRLPELFFDIREFRQVRYDYYDLCHQLWLENWALPLEKWCKDHEIKLTGHYLEHDWPCPYATPEHVHLLAHMDWPGSDMLLGFMLKGHDFFDIQGFEPAPAGAEPHGLLFLRQVHSVANQLGKERVINECWGAGGNETAPEDWMRIGRWLIVHGVNLIVPHSSWDTIRGGRKTDHPPNFAPQSPWFDYLKPLNDELARLCWAGCQGEAINRILVIDSLTSGFCVARKAESSEPAAVTALAQAATGSAEASLPSLRPMNRAAGEFVQGLSDAQMDFDVGDEYVIEEFGNSPVGGLGVGRRSYSCLVLVPGLIHLRSATVRILQDALTRGVHLRGIRPEQFYVDGRPSAVLREWEQEFPDQVSWSPDALTLQDQLRQDVPPRLRVAGEIPPTGLAHMHRSWEDGELVLMVNSHPDPVSATAELDTARKTILELNPVTGEITRLDTSAAKGGWRFPLHLPGCGARIFLATDDAGLAPAAVPSVVLTHTAPVELQKVERLADNVLAIDYCSLELYGEVFPAEPVMAANHRYWRAHGFESNGWNNLIQYRDQLLARDATMTPQSGGNVRYAFEVAPGVDLTNLRLVVECPELWTITVNGVKVKFPEAQTFRDPRFHWTAISAHAREGVNEVALRGRPFSVRQEIDQIYLLGDFACEAADPGFRLAPKKALSWGSWKTQGLSFYDAEVAYQVQVPAGARRLRFPRQDWGGALVTVWQDGREIGRCYETPWTCELPSGGSRNFELRVVGLPFNLFGPWHDANHRWGVANTFMWLGDDLPKRPQKGMDYRLLDLGFFRPPLVEW